MIQIVIDIDNNLYTRLFDNGDEYVEDMRRACVAIRKGKPLLKGHGRLIDADEIKKNQFTLGTSNYCEYKVVTIEAIDKANTIIEADKIDCERTNCDNCVNHKYCDYE